MVTLKINMVWRNVVAFTIDYDLYFYRMQPTPQLFDAELTPQIVYNFDTWFQAKTHQRYSLRGFTDMAEAFAAALQLTYSQEDLCGLGMDVAILTKQQTLVEQIKDYRKFYWIEILDPVKLDTKFAVLLRDKFDHFRSTLGDDQFYNNLCRFYHQAQLYNTTVAGVFERLIKRLDRIPAAPRYPATVELDNELMSVVRRQIFAKFSPYKNVPEDIVAKLNKLCL